MKKIEIADIHRILIVQSAFIGDVVLITPLIRETKKLFPEASLDVLVNPVSAPLLANNPHVKQVILHNKKQRFRLLRLVWRLRKQGYDLVISPHSSFRTHLSLFLSGIPHRIGFARGFLSPVMMNYRLPHGKGIHKRFKNLNLLRAISDKDYDGSTELFPSEADMALADSLLSEAGTWVAVAPGSVWWTKCWPLDHYEQLCLELCKKGFNLVLIGGRDDHTRTHHIEEFCRVAMPSSRVVNAAGACSLLESAAILAKTQLLICNDSGSLHMANAMKVKVLCFFGPTVQSIGYFPFREQDRVLEVDLDCRPCGSHGGRSCPKGHHHCMLNISVEQALSTALEQLPVTYERRRANDILVDNISNSCNSTESLDSSAPEEPGNKLDAKASEADFEGTAL